MSSGRLRFVEGAESGREHPLPEPGAAWILGRGTGCDVRLSDSGASRRHCRLERSADGLELVDLGTTNGTWLNGRRVERARVADGDRILIGDTELVVELDPADRAGERAPSIGSGPPRASRTLLWSDSSARAEPSPTFFLPILGEAEPGSGDLRRRLDAVLEVARALAAPAPADVTELLQHVLDQLWELFPQAERGHLLLGSEVDSLEVAASRTRGSEDRTVLYSRSLCRRALEERALVVYSEAAEGRAPSASIVGLDIHSAMVVPLAFGDEVLGLGILDTSDPGAAYDREDARLAVAVGRQVAVALKNVELVARVREEAVLRHDLSRFLPKVMADRVVRGEIDAGLGGRTVDGTVLFSDLVGFTALSEELTPQETVELMNRYFDAMVPEIESRGGSVDKFIGDAIMAVWGVPGGEEDAPLSAVRAALAMQEALVAFNRRQPADSPWLEMAIGIAHGPLLAGNVGARVRRSYTVLGDTVNTAQRMESLASAGQVLVTRACWERLAGRAWGISLPPLRMKNKRDPVEAWSVRAATRASDGLRLYLPALAGEERVMVLRRDEAGRFAVAAGAGCDPLGAELRSAVPELPGERLGRVESVSAVEADALREPRILEIRLDDPTLGGLLSPRGRRSTVPAEDRVRDAGAWVIAR